MHDFYMLEKSPVEDPAVTIDWPIGLKTSTLFKHPLLRKQSNFPAHELKIKCNFWNSCYLPSKRLLAGSTAMTFVFVCDVYLWYERGYNVLQNLVYDLCWKSWEAVVAMSRQSELCLRLIVNAFDSTCLCCEWISLVGRHDRLSGVEIDKLPNVPRVDRYL